jgi:hypothetical protein
MAILPPEKLVPVAELDAYLMDPAPHDWAKLLAPFCPPLPREGQVILASFFGDVFVEDRDGAVWWVNGLESRVERIAINRDKALERMAQDHLLMLKTKLLEQMIRGDKLLPVGMLYGLKVSRADGGKYHPDNLGTAWVADAFAYMGDQYRRKNAAAPQAAKPVVTPAAPSKGKKAKKPKQKSGSTSGFWGKKK